MWDSEVRSANSSQYFAPLPRMTDTTTTFNNAQPIRGQYCRLLTNQRPGLSLMMSSSLVTIQQTEQLASTFYSLLTLSLEGVTGTHKIQTCLTKHKLAHLKLSLQARNGELKKSISLLEIIQSRAHKLTVFVLCTKIKWRYLLGNKSKAVWISHLITWH